MIKNPANLLQKQKCKRLSKSIRKNLRSRKGLWDFSILPFMHVSKKTVYVETTIPNYATAKPSMDILSANRQTITKLFWEYERDKYKLYISQFVLDECKQGGYLN
jgi:hypothetical protein